MYPGDVEGMSLSEYRQLEMQLHLELINTCRKFISKLGIVSIMGIFDIVKQEALELEKATRESIKREEYEVDNNQKSDIDDYYKKK
jgi:hypothetical protein